MIKVRLKVQTKIISDGSETMQSFVRYNSPTPLLFPKLVKDKHRRKILTDDQQRNSHLFHQSITSAMFFIPLSLSLSVSSSLSHPCSLSLTLALFLSSSLFLLLLFLHSSVSSSSCSSSSTFCYASFSFSCASSSLCLLNPGTQSPNNQQNLLTKCC